MQSLSIRTILLALGMGGLWLMDVANAIGPLNLQLSNSFWDTSPSRAFHLGIAFTIVALVLLALPQRYNR